MAQRKYKFAFDENKSLVNIEDVCQENRHAHKYYCIECGEEMIPVIGTGIRIKHFRHDNTTCSYESYLHKLGKLRFKKLFDEGNSFVVNYFVKYVCKSRRDCPFAYLRPKFNCYNVYDYKELDLKKYYDECQPEVAVGDYRADLLFTSKNEKVKPLLLEIHYKHESTEEKMSSGYPIVEIDVQEEEDICLPICETEPIDTFFIDRRRKLPKQTKIVGFSKRIDVNQEAIDKCKPLITENLSLDYKEIPSRIYRTELESMSVVNASAPSVAVQKGWYESSQFLCCPSTMPSAPQDALDLYIKNIEVKKQFVRFDNGFWNYIIDYARWKDSIYVITNQGKRHYCIFKITIKNGKYHHELLDYPFLYEGEAMSSFASRIEMEYRENYETDGENTEKRTCEFVGKRRE